MKMKVYGVRHTKGEMEGNAFDFIKLHSMARMERKATQSGGAGVDMRGIPELATELLKIDFWNNGNGIECEVTTEPMALGGGNVREVVVSCKPLQKAA